MGAWCFDAIGGQVSAGGSSVTENSGGKTWAQCLTYPSPDGVGWREEKFSDGRLKLWVWDWWTISANTRTGTYSFPAAATDFIDTPTWSHAAKANAAFSIDFAITSLTVNTSFNFQLCRTGNNGKVAVAVCFEGHWA